MTTVVEEVPPSLDGQRLDRVVAMITGASRAGAAALVVDGAVRVDGTVRTNGAARISAAEVLSVELTDVAASEPEPDPGVAVTVVHADEHVIVVDKPAGLVVHPGAGHAEGTLVQGLLARFPELAGVGDPERPGIVHRLDQGTSGLLAVARTGVAYTGLVAQLADRTMTRRYDTLVWGVPDSVEGVVDAPIGRSQRDPTRTSVTADGRPARTHYRVDATFTAPAPLARLACRLETGRTHQVRVHLAAIDHPVVGDRRYGRPPPPGSLTVDRPFLHAAHLGFTHPVTGAALTFDAPLPPDLEAVLSQLR